MSDEKNNPMSADFLEASLKRLRKRLTYVQDEMDITSFAIRAIEHDLKEIRDDNGVKSDEKNA